VAELDAIGNKLTYKIAEIAMANPFYYDVDKLVDELEDWGTRNYQLLFEMIMREALIQGYCIVELFDTQPYWLIYSGSDISNERYNPALSLATVDVNVTVGEQVVHKTLKIDNKKVFLVQYGYNRSSTGCSILVPVWDDLTYLRLMKHNMCQFDARLGSGFPVVIVGKDTTADDISDIAVEMDKVDSKAGIILPSGSDLKFPTAAQTDFPAHMQLLLQNIAGNTGLPIKWLNGESKGAVLASEEDAAIGRTVIETMFKKFNRSIKMILDVLYGLDSVIAPNVTVSLDEGEADAKNQSDLGEGSDQPDLPEATVYKGAGA